MSDQARRPWEASGPPPLWTEPELAYYEVDYVRGLKARIAELEAERDELEALLDASPFENQRQHITELQAHLRELEAERDEAQMEFADALIRITELEAELDVARTSSWVPTDRPDNVVVIDGKRWKVTEVRAGDAPSLRDATLVPVEDTDE